MCFYGGELVNLHGNLGIITKQITPNCMDEPLDKYEIHDFQYNFSVIMYRRDLLPAVKTPERQL